MRVQVRANGASGTERLLLRVPGSLDELLAAAGTALALPARATLLFLEDGTQVESLQDLSEGAVVVVSSGGAFEALPRADSMAGGRRVVLLHQGRRRTVPLPGTMEALAAVYVNAFALPWTTATSIRTSRGPVASLDDLVDDDEVTMAGTVPAAAPAAALSPTAGAIPARMLDQYLVLKHGNRRRAVKLPETMADLLALFVHHFGLESAPAKLTDSKGSTISDVSALEDGDVIVAEAKEGKKPRSSLGGSGVVGAGSGAGAVAARPRTVLVYGNGKPVDGYGKTVAVGTTIQQVLAEATQQLGMPIAAKRLFGADGQEIHRLDALKAGMPVVVSSGEAFAAPDAEPDAPRRTAGRLRVFLFREDQSLADKGAQVLVPATFDAFRALVVKKLQLSVGPNKLVLKTTDGTTVDKLAMVRDRMNIVATILAPARKSSPVKAAVANTSSSGGGSSKAAGRRSLSPTKASAGSSKQHTFSAPIQPKKSLTALKEDAETGLLVLHEHLRAKHAAFLSLADTYQSLYSQFLALESLYKDRPGVLSVVGDGFVNLPKDSWSAVSELMAVRAELLKRPVASSMLAEVDETLVDLTGVSVGGASSSKGSAMASRAALEGKVGRLETELKHEYSGLDTLSKTTRALTVRGDIEHRLAELEAMANDIARDTAELVKSTDLLTAAHQQWLQIKALGSEDKARVESIQSRVVSELAPGQEQDQEDQEEEPEPETDGEDDLVMEVTPLPSPVKNSSSAGMSRQPLSTGPSHRSAFSVVEPAQAQESVQAPAASPPQAAKQPAAAAAATAAAATTTTATVAASAPKATEQQPAVGAVQPGQVQPVANQSPARHAQPHQPYHPHSPAQQPHHPHQPSHQHSPAHLQQQQQQAFGQPFGQPMAIGQRMVMGPGGVPMYAPMQMPGQFAPNVFFR